MSPIEFRLKRKPVDEVMADLEEGPYAELQPIRPLSTRRK